MTSVQVERTNSQIEAYNATGCFIGGQVMTGHDGTADWTPGGANITNLVWAAGSPPVVTATTAQPHGLANGTYRLQIELVGGQPPASYDVPNMPAGFLLATFNSGTMANNVFTYQAPGLANPGGFTGQGIFLLDTTPISSGGTFNPGSGYTNGTYTNVPLTGGSGVGALATIVVSGNVISTVTVTFAGRLYADGDTISASSANIGGTGSGFSTSVEIVNSVVYWNWPMQYCLRVRAANQCTFFGFNPNSNCAVATVDLDYAGIANGIGGGTPDPAANQQNNLLIGAFGIQGWIPPRGKNRAGWKFIECTGNTNPFDQVYGAGTASFPTTFSTPYGQMVFADLPGNTSNQPGPFEGQEYDIIDSQNAASGNFANTTTGSGGNHVKVRYATQPSANWFISG